MKLNFRLLILIPMFALSLMSCSKENKTADLETYVKIINARPEQKIAPLPNLEIPVARQFTMIDLRDPFRPFEKKIVKTQKPEGDRASDPLEKFPLDALKMMGTIKQGHQTWGLLQTPNGVSRVKVGEYIGQNAGLIVKITNKEITIAESVPGIGGDWEKRTIKIQLDG
jgi:type IV pilus assembly protein PilP